MWRIILKEIHRRLRIGQFHYVILKIVEYTIFCKNIFFLVCHFEKIKIKN